MKYLQSALAAVRGDTLPEMLQQGGARTGPAYEAALEQVRRQGLRVYGLNTLPGHLDTQSVPEESLSSYQHQLIENHTIGTAPYFDMFTARCIGHSKAWSVAAGRQLVSQELYERILAAITDPAFIPEIPARASYSSGDVIPAAHWARAVLEHTEGQDLRPGEGMALINGAFVHTGMAMNAWAEYRRVLPFLLDTMSRSVSLMRPAPAFLDPDTTPSIDLSAVLAELARTLPEPDETFQKPVSIRSIPRQVEALMMTGQHLGEGLDVKLASPSGNPLIEQGGAVPHSSGSFVDPTLTLLTRSLIEAVLMAGWNSVQRTSYLLSGKVRGIPVNGRLDDNRLGLIQWPKLAQAHLEAMRQEHAASPFVSGSDTSYGTEDFWSHGTSTARRLVLAIGQLVEIVSIERETTLYAAEKFFDDGIGSKREPAPDTSEEMSAACSASLDRFYSRGDQARWEAVLS